jgi:Tol biopolymer transport system component
VQWWAARPGVLVFNQTPQDEGGWWAGYLGAIDLATGERMDLDMLSSSYSGFVLSPDGRTILYDDAGSPVLYRWDEGIVRLYMPDYGLDYTRYAAPAWSPDGSLSAFYATRQGIEGTTEAAIVLVNLQTGQARELHPHQSFGQRGAPEIAFSPDGKWLAVVNPGEAETVQNGPMSLWVLAVDGSSETYLGYGTGPVWSPTGDKLLFTLWPPVGSGGGSFQEDAHITLTVAGEWALQEMDPMVGSTLFDWVALP